MTFPFLVVQWQDGVESSSSPTVDIASPETSYSFVLTRGTAWAVSLTQRGGIREEMSRICFSISGDGNHQHLLYRFLSEFSTDCPYINACRDILYPLGVSACMSHVHDVIY